MIEGERADLRPMAAPRGRPMEMVQPLVMAKLALGTAMLQEMLEFDPGRACRGAAVARDHQGPAGIGQPTGFGQGCAAQIAAEESAHESIAGAQHIVDLDGKALDHEALLEAGRDRAIEGYAAVLAG